MGLIHGIQALTKVLTPILVDSSGRVKVIYDGQGINPEVTIGDCAVTLPVEEQSPINANYDVNLTYKANLSLAAGTNYLDDDAIAAGEIWEVRGMAFRYTGTITSVILYPYIKRAGVYYYNMRITPIVSANIYGYSVSYALKGGDNFGLQINAATLNNDIEMWLNYSRIK